MKKVTIIGGGPIGCYLGYLLAKAGFDVVILEEHEKIGIPIQCTGILTSKIEEITGMDHDFLVNKIVKTRVFSPDKGHVEFDLGVNYIVDRHLFDDYFADFALKENAKIIFNSRFIGFDKKKNEVVILKDGKNKAHYFHTDFLVGCDGPSSKVYPLINDKERKNWIGLHATAKLKNDNMIDFYPWMGTYAWIVPENKDIVRIGLAMRNTPDARDVFKDFLKSHLGNGFKEKIMGYQAGLIPEYDPKINFSKGNIFLVGDSASQVKATTGGGLVPGLLAAKSCAESIMMHRDYKKLLKKSIDKNLRIHLYLRKMLDKFSKNDWNFLIQAFKQEKMKKVLQKYDRDSPFLIVTSIFFNKPSLVKFARYL